jgi:hypothetical protein
MQVMRYCVPDHENPSVIADSLLTGQYTEETVMYKWFATILIVYFIGDPNLAYMPSAITVDQMKDLFLAGVISLFLMPCVSAQFDN